MATAVLVAILVTADPSALTEDQAVAAGDQDEQHGKEPTALGAGPVETAEHSGQENQFQKTPRARSGSRNAPNSV